MKCQRPSRQYRPYNGRRNIKSAMKYQELDLYQINSLILVVLIILRARILLKVPRKKVQEKIVKRKFLSFWLLL